MHAAQRWCRSRCDDEKQKNPAAIYTMTANNLTANQISSHGAMLNSIAKARPLNKTPVSITSGKLRFNHRFGMFVPCQT